MKFSTTHKIVSISLAFLVVFSTLSLSIEKHFCGDFLVDVALFSETKKCASETKQDNCLNVAVKKPCCKDEIQIVDSIDHLITNDFYELPIEQQQFIVAFGRSYNCLFVSLPKTTIPYKNYKPPNLHKNFQIQHETFLI